MLRERQYRVKYETEIVWQKDWALGAYGFGGREGGREGLTI